MSDKFTVKETIGRQSPHQPPHHLHFSSRKATCSSIRISGRLPTMKNDTLLLPDFLVHYLLTSTERGVCFLFQTNPPMYKHIPHLDDLWYTDIIAITNIHCFQLLHKHPLSLIFFAHLVPLGPFSCGIVSVWFTLCMPLPSALFCFALLRQSHYRMQTSLEPATLLLLSPGCWEYRFMTEHLVMLAFLNNVGILVSLFIAVTNMTRSDVRKERCGLVHRLGYHPSWWQESEASTIRKQRSTDMAARLPFPFSSAQDPHLGGSSRLS